MTGVNSVQVIVDFSETAATDNLFFDDTTLGLFDTGEFAATNEGVDISSYVRSGQATIGAQRVDAPLVRFDAGHATIVLDNRDRRFDPTNLSGPYAAGGVSQVTPMRKVQIKAGAGPWQLFTGWVDSWTLDYPANGNDATVTLTATDGSKILAAFDGPEQASQGAGETTFARFIRILNHVGSLGTFPVYASGHTTTCQATTLASNAWTEILLTADTEMGDVYFGAYGTPTFTDRHWVYRGSPSVGGDPAGIIPSRTFGAGGGSEVPYTAIDITYDDQRVYNDISIARTGGTAQTAENAVSQTQYLTHTYSRTDLVHQTDAESQLYADYLLALCKDPAITINSITVGADQAVSASYAYLYEGSRVKFTPPGGGSIISRRVIARGFEHTWGADSGVVTKITFEDAERYKGLVFDSTTNGILDTNWFVY